MKLPNDTVTPPGGWRYQVPETGLLIRTGGGFRDLLNEVRRHYSANSIPAPDNLLDLVEDWVCAQLKTYCVDNVGNVQMLPQLQASRLSVRDVKAGTQALLRLRERVPQEVADARARVCAGTDTVPKCPYNVPVDCSSCMQRLLRNLAEAITGKRTTRHDGGLAACSICNCSLKAKVWVDLDANLDVMTQPQKEALPKWCWMETEKALATSGG